MSPELWRIAKKHLGLRPHAAHSDGKEVFMTDNVDRATSAAERPIDGPSLAFDVPALLTQLKRERAWRTGSRNGLTLLKTDGLRVVLVAMHAGTTIPAHSADGAIAVEVVEGELTCTAGTEQVALGEGQLFTLQAGIPHGLHATDDCSYLLTIAGSTPHPAE
jgi:quercetin dioxygenase-like cupin family protein